MDNPNHQKTPSTIPTLDSGQPPNGTVYDAERPQEMAMISNTERANITHSQLTMAGNNVNNYSVNIVLNGRPSHSRRREPKDWPGPYSRPEPPLESSSRIPLGRPSTRTMVNNIVSEKGKARDFTNSQTDSSANTVHNLSGNMEIASLDHLEIDAHLAKTAGPVRMPHEIYVKQLYSCGQGYPCANPKPWGEAVKVGDIGLLSDGGFVVLENLYALPDNFLQDEPAPVIPTVSDRNVLAEGIPLQVA
ncbi:hypothetical protein BKA70DRAFT_483464 [Coprinopsis sp. MPI-PUGE-AT-0042]|nr:hypothetical protein BKA70DRAFT_483464 [Coprinopsis sp. MPI-PUGE-AT-0042]